MRKVFIDYTVNSGKFTYFLLKRQHRLLHCLNYMWTRYTYMHSHLSKEGRKNKEATIGAKFYLQQDEVTSSFLHLPWQLGKYD